MLAETVASSVRGANLAVVCLGVDAQVRSSVLGSRPAADGLPLSASTILGMAVDTVFAAFYGPSKASRDERLAVCIAAATTLREECTVLGAPVVTRCPDTAKEAIAAVRTRHKLVTDDATIMYMMSLSVTGAWRPGRLGVDRYSPSRGLRKPVPVFWSTTLPPTPVPALADAANQPRVLSHLTFVDTPAVCQPPDLVRCSRAVGYVATDSFTRPQPPFGCALSFAARRAFPGP